MGSNVSKVRLFLRKLRKACELGNEETRLKNAVKWMALILVESRDN